MNRKKVLIFLILLIAKFLRHDTVLLVIVLSKRNIRHVFIKPNITPTVVMHSKYQPHDPMFLSYILRRLLPIIHSHSIAYLQHFSIKTEVVNITYHSTNIVIKIL